MINVNLIYPIGAVYISINSTNPSNIFGGTWSRIKGKMLVGVDEDDTDFKQSCLTGGEKKHVLTVDELAAHDHYLNISGNDDLCITINAATGGNNYNMAYNNGGQTTENGPYVMASKTGKGTPHNNMPPYYTVYIFVRTA